MSTLEYGTYSGPALQGDSLHRCLIDLQDATIRKHHFKLPGLSLDEYEDLYGRAILKLFEKYPNASFPAPQAVIAWLDTTIERAAIDQLRRRRLARETNNVVSVTDAREGEGNPIALQPVDAEPTPEQRVLLDEQDLTLKEFIASLNPDDRRISLLHLHPGSRMKLKQIAVALDLPTAQINRVLKRVDKRFSRYVALEVDEVCALRQRDLATWQRTGEMPSALRWHVKRCSRCNAKVQEARTEVYHSVLPLVGAVGLSTGGGLGFFAKLYHGLGAHPLIIRAHDELSRVKKMSAFGASGGGALVTAKTVAITAVVGTAAAIGGGVAVLNSITSTRPAQTTPVISTVTTTTSTPVTTRTPAAKLAGSPKRKHESKPETRKRTVSHHTVATSTVTSTPVVSSPPAVTSTPAATSTPKVTTTSGTTPKTSKPPATSTSSSTHSSSSTAGGLPDLQQTEQAP